MKMKALYGIWECKQKLHADFYSCRSENADRVKKKIGFKSDIFFFTFVEFGFMIYFSF